MNHQETYGSQSNNQKHKCKEIKHKQNTTNDKTNDAVRVINFVMCNKKINDAIEKYNIHQYINNYTD